ncbi:hypothetical protein [Methanosarcina vacuolata]|uniref:hypothetical protein n=1 Tax=Methanosarcina vacuolata TaxID=2215 RepID=UPI000A9862F5|nr:hypothetical protein [Methanosarcina vacuolata]
MKIVLSTGNDEEPSPVLAFIMFYSSSLFSNNLAAFSVNDLKNNVGTDLKP